MKRKTGVIIAILLTLLSIFIAEINSYAGQVSVTASVLVIIPERETTSETKVVKEENSKEENEEQTEVAYAKGE